LEVAPEVAIVAEEAGFDITADAETVVLLGFVFAFVDK
jgi:hypothetical protein